MVRGGRNVVLLWVYVTEFWDHLLDAVVPPLADSHLRMAPRLHHALSPASHRREGSAKSKLSKREVFAVSVLETWWVHPGREVVPSSPDSHIMAQPRHRGAERARPHASVRCQYRIASVYGWLRLIHPRARTRVYAVLLLGVTRIHEVRTRPSAAFATRNHASP